MKPDLAIAAVLLACVAAATPAVNAGAPPATCSAIPGCPLTTDLVIFGEGLPGGYEITFRITDCTTCSGPAAGFLLGAVMEAEFGPYTTGTCSSGDDLVTLDTTATSPRFMSGTTVLPEQSCVPLDGSQSFTPTLIDDLRTACVDSGGSDPNLDFNIPRLRLTGNDGARTQGVLTNRPRLTFPLSVRSTDGLDRVVPHFDFRQDLTFTVAETLLPATTVRFWPDGLPLRLGPLDITYTAPLVTFTTPGEPIGPPAYTPAPPALSNVPLDPNLSVVSCMPFGDLCTDDTALINDGYFMNGFWAPSAAAFDVNGLDVTLDLGAAHLVTYEPVFPRGVKLTLNGDATIDIDDSEVAGGGFFGGTAFFRCNDNHRITSTGPIYTNVTRSLNTSPFAPELLAGGGVLAGVSDLNQGAENLVWTYNEASALECGTLFVPDALADKERDAPGMIVGPQYEWLAAADLLNPDPDKVDGRGVYGGVNYNRDGACVGGALEGLLCTADPGCDPGVGEAGTCDVGRWSPKCPDLTLGTTPTWATGIQNVNPKLQKSIVPGDAAQADREMAFFARQSGITGVFDAGNDDFTFQPAGGFQIDFDRFGWAFLDSRSCPGDTITDGGLVFPWPADESISFAEMKFCDCSALKTSRITESLTEHTLAYWDAAFKPYNLYFSPAVDADCELVSGTGCLADSLNAAATACIDAVTPVQHLKPDPLATFGLTPAGEPSNGGVISLKAGADFDFEEPVDVEQEPYVLHMEEIRLTPWDGATENAVQGGTHNFGCYNVTGKAQLPYFGETDAGLMIGKAQAADSFHTAEMHEAEQLGALCDPSNLAIGAERAMGAGCIEVAQNLCYLRPSLTEEANGTDAQGAGVFVGYASETGGGSVDPADIDFGASQVALSTTIDGDQIRGDIGAGAPLAAYAVLANTGQSATAARDRLKACVPSGRLGPAAIAEYDAALAKMGGAMPNPSGVPDTMHGTGAIDDVKGQPDAQESFRVVGPTLTGQRITGWLEFSNDVERIEQANIDSDMFAADGGNTIHKLLRTGVGVARHVKSTDNPIIEVFGGPGFGPFELIGDFLLDLESLFMMDYDLTVQNCQYGFQSITGSFHMSGGALSTIGFPEVSATHYWDSTGSAYFDASIEAEFLNHKAGGAFLIGRLVDISLMQDRDPEVTSFLGDVNAFSGSYVSGSAGGRLLNLGCLLRIDVGGQVAGWWNLENLKPGAKLRGWVSGKGACLVSVHGDLSLVASPAGLDVLEMQGSFWVAGGIGFCEEDEWDTPQDVLGDKACLACVISKSQRYLFHPLVPVPFLTEPGQTEAVCK